MVTSAGIDVGKKVCQVALRHKDGEYLERSFSNDSKGLQKCAQFFRMRGVSKETPLVLESTGGYHLLFAMALRDTHHYGGVKVINGILTKKYSSANIRKIKTDSVDAKILADIGEKEKLISFNKSKEEFIQRKRITLLKKLDHIRQQLTSSTDDLKEIGEILGLPIEAEERSKEILVSIEKEIKLLLKEISRETKSELADELAKIDGVSRETISIILSLIGDKKFESRNQFVAFTGMDLTIRESGSSINGKRHLSKRGDAFLRKKLFQTAWALKMHNSEYQKYYEKKRKEGHHYFTCLIAIGRKFLRHIYGLQRKLENKNSSLASQSV
jgi:transposase